MPGLGGWNPASPDGPRSGVGILVGRPIRMIGTMTEPTQGPAPKPTFEQRMESFGRQVDDAGERFGRDAEAWGKRLADDPTVRRAGDTAARIWGLLLLAAGLWFFADV